MASLIGAFNSWSAWWNYVTLTLNRNQEQEATWRNQYDYLRAYYLSNGLYDVLREKYRSIGYTPEALRPLRNPAYRTVEFYAAKLWPGALPDALPMITTNEQLQPAIEQLWLWSNWGSEKQAAARSFAVYGDLFLKIATRSDQAGNIQRVWMQNLEPQTVTDMTSDERGYLTYVRLDTPQQRRDADGKLKPYTLTEVWEKDTQTFRRWQHDKTVETELKNLGTPTEEKPFSAFGIDFVPIVWQPFRHIGDERGMAAITPAIDKIDEANRQATRLHQMLFRYNKPLWAAAANGMDSTGRPLPPPRLGGSNGDTLELSDNDDDIIRLPGTTSLTAMVPSINYDSALSVITAQMDEIAHDLPELIYSDLHNRTDLSGKAIRYLLGAAIDRLVEARGNAEHALVRAQQMALTIGANAGLFPNLGGTFESGAFDHSFAARPVLELSEGDQADIVKVYFDAGVPLPTATKRAGWSADEIVELENDLAKKATEEQTQMALALVNAQRNFDQGNQTPGATNAG